MGSLGDWLLRNPTTWVPASIWECRISAWLIIEVEGQASQLSATRLCIVVEIPVNTMMAKRRPEQDQSFGKQRGIRRLLATREDSISFEPRFWKSKAAGLPVP